MSSVRHSVTVSYVMSLFSIIVRASLPFESCSMASSRCFSSIVSVLSMRASSDANTMMLFSLLSISRLSVSCVSAICGSALPFMALSQSRVIAILSSFSLFITLSVKVSFSFSIASSRCSGLTTELLCLTASRRLFFRSAMTPDEKLLFISWNICIYVVTGFT